MQMKQGVASRLSRKGKSVKAGKPLGIAAAPPDDPEVLAEVVDEEELEVSSVYLMHTTARVEFHDFNLDCVYRSL